MRVRAEGHKHPMHDPNTKRLAQKDTAGWMHGLGDFLRLALQILVFQHDFKKQPVRQARIN